MIVIPMAGLSSRFKKEGYKSPKYMLKAKGKTLFHHSVESFNKYFDQEFFLFITLNTTTIKKFIEDECEILGVKNYKIIILEKPTNGQAETVYKGLKKSKNIDVSNIYIFNIDTFRPNFTKPTSFDLDCIDGYLETFVGSGSNWSNILPCKKGSDKVKLTAEKKEISEYCCTGLYYWKSSKVFFDIYERSFKKGMHGFNSNEFYIAPMYNLLIEEGGDVRYTVIDKKNLIICGTPREYESFIMIN
jgi:NDP-sugar pyrophosphorylase family protein